MQLRATVTSSMSLPPMVMVTRVVSGRNASNCGGDMPMTTPGWTPSRLSSVALAQVASVKDATRNAWRRVWGSSPKIGRT